MQRSISVVIPTFNRRETALLAARSALGQTRSPLEVLVVCDGCTDGTVEAVGALGDPRARALDLPKAPGHGYENRTRALERARGDVVAYLSDDDLWLPDHLERHGSLYDAGVADIVSSMAVVVHPDDSLQSVGWDWRHERQRLLLVDERLNNNPMSSVSHERQRALDLGGWPDVARRGDAELWRALLLGGGRPGCVSEPTVLHFKATGRDQSDADRVVQNGAWWGSICDPDRLTALRARLSFELTGRLIAEQEAHADTERQRAALNEQAIRQTERIDELQRQLQAVQGGGRRRLLGRSRP
jgi:hypothetical protein